MCLKTSLFHSRYYHLKLFKPIQNENLEAVGIINGTAFFLLEKRSQCLAYSYFIDLFLLLLVVVVVIVVVFLYHCYSYYY